MQSEFLESAEFYNRRYHNFSSRVIVPMSLLLVFLLGFATFAEKEISLSTRATVEPSRILANIPTAFFDPLTSPIDWRMLRPGQPPPLAGTERADLLA